MSSSSYNDAMSIERHIQFVSGLSKRIKEARELRGVSQAAVAEACRISRAAVAQWESEEKPTAPTADKIEPICDLLEVDPVWLLTGTHGKWGGKAGTDVGVTTVSVPEYNVQVSAGGGFYINAETKRDIWLFSRRYLIDELRLDASQLVVLEVIGDSMEPTLRTGDRVMVNMNDKRVSQPGVFVLWDGDGTVVKRLEKIPNSKPQKLRSISDNPIHNAYDILTQDAMIVGRVVWYARRI
jgi:phage repressor protein C with HTH and peptisase S24 domain